MKYDTRKRVAVIMAGGSGERFWPLSRSNKPKQFLQFSEERTTLLDSTISNISPLFHREHIFFATAAKFADSISKTRTGIVTDNIIIEPYKRNTSGCLALAAAELLTRYGGDGSSITMGIFPADHNIADPEKLRKTVHAALSVAEKEPALVTIGIKPDCPATGYGYMKISSEEHVTAGNLPVFHVDRFCEKPDLQTAKKYLSTGQFYWNSGMFFWRLSTFLDELKSASPALFTAIEDMVDAITRNDKILLETVFKGLEDISIDYALMEKTNHVLVLKADFGWDDMGTWDAIERILPADDRGNVTVGDPVVIDSNNCIIFNAPGSETTAVGVIGVDSLAVIVTEDGVLVIPKERSQDVKQVVSELKRRKSKQL